MLKNQPDKPFRELPADWQEQVLDHMNDNLATWQIVEEEKPHFIKALGDYVVAIKLIDGGDHLKDYGVNKGEVCGFAFYHKILV